MGGGYAIGQIGKIMPLLLWTNPVAEIPQVSMNINDTGHDGFTRTIYNFGISRYGHGTHRANGFNNVTLHEHRTTLDDLIALHRDDAGIFKGHTTFRLIGY